MCPFHWLFTLSCESYSGVLVGLLQPPELSLGDRQARHDHGSFLFTLSQGDPPFLHKRTESQVTLSGHFRWATTLEQSKIHADAVYKYNAVDGTVGTTVD